MVKGCSGKPLLLRFRIYDSMAINKYLPFAILYFFLNAVALPFGLTYMALLAPLFYWWVVSTRKREILLPFFLLIFPLVFVHIVIVGVNSRVYLISLLNVATVYIFCHAFYTFLKTCNDPENIFKKVTIINFVLCVIAIVFYFTGYSSLFWIRQTLTEGINDFERLKLFTYEPSYYATLMVPLFFFYFLKIIFNQNETNAWFVFLVILLPFLLSFSLGVMSVMLVSVLIVFAVYFRRLLQRKRVLNLFFMGILVLIPVGIMGTIVFPDNIFFFRLQNIFSGYDSSGKGRTFEAFILSAKILALKSNFWGIGLGQIKVIGTDVIKDFYLYPVNYKTVAIPNATAETLTVFGFFGLACRIGAEIFLFFYTQVWKNYYRFILFFFMFIYQFGGSFITNLAEYVIWILAFTNVFKQFDVPKKQPLHFPLHE